MEDWCQLGSQSTCIFEMKKRSSGSFQVTVLPPEKQTDRITVRSWRMFRSVLISSSGKGVASLSFQLSAICMFSRRSKKYTRQYSYTLEISAKSCQSRHSRDGQDPKIPRKWNGNAGRMNGGLSIGGVR